MVSLEELLSRGVEKIYPDREALEKLLQQRKIRLYLGIDPTGNRLHLGHAILLRKLQKFAELGHEAILLIGTGTVLAGEASQTDDEGFDFHCLPHQCRSVVQTRYVPGAFGTREHRLGQRNTLPPSSGVRFGCSGRRPGDRRDRPNL